MSNKLPGGSGALAWGVLVFMGAVGFFVYRLTGIGGLTAYTMLVLMLIFATSPRAD